MEETEGRYLVCKMKHGYEKLAENITIVIIVCLVVAIILTWIALNVFVSGVVLGFITEWSTDVVPPATFILVALAALNGACSSAPLFSQDHKKDHVDTNIVEQVCMVIVTALFGMELVVISLAVLNIQDLLIKILMGIIVGVLIIPSIYILLYNACEFRLYIAGVGRYAKKEEDKKE